MIMTDVPDCQRDPNRHPEPAKDQSPDYKLSDVNSLWPYHWSLMPRDDREGQSMMKSVEIEWLNQTQPDAEPLLRPPVNTGTERDYSRSVCLIR